MRTVLGLMTLLSVSPALATLLGTMCCQLHDLRRYRRQIDDSMTSSKPTTDTVRYLRSEVVPTMRA